MQAQLILPETDKSHGRLGENTLEKARSLFEEDGILLVENVFERSYIDRLQRAWFDQHAGWAECQEPAEGLHLQVGHRRWMVTLEMKPPFDDPLIYANPFVLPMLKAFLGNKCILQSFTSVVSLPGARVQHRHADHPPLFESAEETCGRLPSHAVTAVIPLVDVDERCGTTALWAGSHRCSDTYGKDPVLPFPRMGGCYLMDYRVIHGGTANVGDRARPILYIVYSRPWFWDSANFRRQPPVMIGASTLRQVAEEHRHLFAQTQAFFVAAGQSTP